MRITQKRGILKCAAAVLIAVLLAFSPLSSLAAYYLHAAYDHDSPDPAWLNDLVIRESVYSQQDLQSSCVLVAVPEYPYTETADSFSEKVNAVVNLYSLAEVGSKAAYLYLFRTLNQFAAVETDDATDEEVKTYLTEQGFVFPTTETPETIIVARALYYAHKKGVATQYASFYRGEPIGVALVQFAAGVCGYDISELAKWVPNGDINDLRSFVIAVSKAALYNEGYDVEPETSDEEVSRLVAAMVTRNAGYAVDSDLSFDQLRTRYLAAMLGTVYGVSVDSDALSAAQLSSEIPLYIIRLIGKSRGVTVPADADMAKAFMIVASGSDEFSFDHGKFWSDVYSYKISLANRRSSLWVWPTAASNSQNDPGSTVVVDINGKVVEDAKYTEVAIDPNADTQLMTITVGYAKDGVTSTCTYTITVDQTDAAGYLPGNTAPEATTQAPNAIAELVDGIIGAAGMRNPQIEAFSVATGISLPGKVSDIAELLIPSFDGTSTGASERIAADEAQAIDLLDSLGSAANLMLDGVGGYTAFMDSSSIDETIISLLDVSFGE